LNLAVVARRPGSEVFEHARVDDIAILMIVEARIQPIARAHEERVALTPDVALPTSSACARAARLLRPLYDARAVCPQACRRHRASPEAFRSSAAHAPSRRPSNAYSRRCAK